MTPTLRNRSKTLARGALIALLAFFFLTAGLPKLLGWDTPIAGAGDFERWGYPAWFRPAIGGAEILGALALLLPRPMLASAPPRFWASLGLALNMVGAVVTHLAHAEPSNATLPLVLFAFSGALAFLSRPARTSEAARAAFPDNSA